MSYQQIASATCRFGSVALILAAVAACDDIYGVGDLRGVPIVAGSAGIGNISPSFAGAGGAPSGSSFRNASSGLATSVSGGAQGGAAGERARSEGGAFGNGNTTGVTSLGGTMNDGVPTQSGSSETQSTAQGGRMTSSGIAATGGISGTKTSTSNQGGTPGTTSVPNAVGGSLGTTRVGAERDDFGIERLYPTLEQGKQWHANWGAPARSFSDKDPNDEWVDARQGNARYIVDGDGTLKVTGEWPRIDVRDPRLADQWRDVEITIYLQRVQDENTSWGGILSVARTNHGIVGAVAKGQYVCDTRGLGMRLRYDGRTEFVKETSHFVLGTGDFADLTTIALQTAWSGGIPYNQWLGYKHVVYDLPDGSVKQELWLDQAAGADGGTWVKINEYIDVGGVFGAGGAPCATGIDPTMPLTNRPSRLGSESGLPNIAVYFQSGQVGTNGLLYKWASVREIVAPKP